jgi:hypothetical protein
MDIPVYEISDCIRNGFQPTKYFTDNYSFAWLQTTLMKANISYANAQVVHTVNGWQIFITGKIQSFRHEALLP